MNGTHAMLSHFPVGFWALATLMILVGVFLSGRLAELSRAALLPVLILSLIGGLAAIIVGFLVWPMEANLASPLTRNHILMSFWSLGIYTMITVLVWKAGDAAFDGNRRWALVILALTGGLMFSAAGTLGGAPRRRRHGLLGCSRPDGLGGLHHLLQPPLGQRRDGDHRHRSGCARHHEPTQERMTPRQTRAASSRKGSCLPCPLTPPGTGED